MASRTIKARGDYIRGRFLRSRHPDGLLPSRDPGDTDTLLGEFPLHAGALEEALAAARQAQPEWQRLTVAARVAALQKLRAELRNRHDDLADLLARETGRPPWETQGEVRAMYGVLDGVLRHALAELALHQSPPGASRVTVAPLGVIGVISPFPQPALLMHADAIAAMAAGCTVVCKPSEQAPATAQLYAEIVHEADLPRGVFNLVQGGPTVGAGLAASPETDGVLFCGSERSGRELLSRLQGSPGKMVRTLLSGHAAALVLDDACLDDAAYRIVIGACTGAGQRCTSTRRVVVQRRIAAPLTDRLVHLLHQIRIGHATEPEVFMGPLVHEGVVERYLTGLKRLGELGGQVLLAGGARSSQRRGHYVTPAFYRMSGEAQAESSTEEAIGPLLTIAAFDELEEGLTLAQSSPLGLVLAVFCRSERTLEVVRQRQRTGLCLHNLPTTKSPAKLPLWPAGRSGNGIPGGILTARACTRVLVEHGAEEALDLTMLPPGLPRDLASLK